MAWVRVTDTFNFAPEWMSAAGLGAMRGDMNLVTLLKGHVMALYTQSAVAWTDYIVNYGTAVTVVGMQDVDRVIADLVKIGIMQPIETDEDGNPRWKLLERDDFIHIIKSDEKLMKTKRRRDRSNAPLVVQVLLRDGDECRYCGIEVKWGDTKTDEGQTFDHREPEAPTTPDNYVQCCRGCNRLRADLPKPDDELPLLPPPENPVYDTGAMKMLRKWSSITARMCQQLGIDNPIISGRDASALTASEATDPGIPTSSSPEPTASQAECDPQLPARHDARVSGRAANEKTRRARRTPIASVGEAQSVVVRSSSPEPTASQAECMTQAPVAESVRSVGSAKGKPVRVQSRRRRGRRR